MKQKTVLITGATGFIGSHLAKKLIENGEKIRCLVRTSSPKITIDYLNKLDVELVNGDLLDNDSLRRAVDGVDTIFHLGGGGRVGMPKEICFKINVEGTRNILDICLEQGAINKFVHVSTCAVMGNIKGDKPADETYPYNPNNIVYSKVKTETEKIVLSYKNRLPLIVVRFPGVYGPPLMKEDANRIDGVTPALMMLSAIKNRQWMYVGSGKNLIHLVYINDAVRGFILAAEKGKTGEKYIIGNKKSITMEEMVYTIAYVLNMDAPNRHVPIPIAKFFSMMFELKSNLFGGTPRMSREMVTGFVANMNIDISKAKHELSYEPKVGLEEGMRRTIEWYEENEYL